MEKPIAFIKKNKIALVVILIIVGWFYWFQWRPASIRKACATQSQKRYTEMFKSADADPDITGDKVNDGFISASRIERYREYAKEGYATCLNAHGLKN